MKLEFKLQWKDKKIDLNDCKTIIEKSDCSSRELYVLRLLSLGRTNKEIADELNIEISTVKTHVQKIYKKLNLSNRKQTRIFKEYFD